jgi:GIY-YIG catalytic domain
MLVPDTVDVSAILWSGIYFLLRRGTIVYIGQSRNLHARINAHCNSKGKIRQGRRILFDQILVQHCALEDLDDIERDLIHRYKPFHNKEHNAHIPMAQLLKMLPSAPLHPTALEPRTYSGRRF